LRTSEAGGGAGAAISPSSSASSPNFHDFAKPGIKTQKNQKYSWHF
jgi:hypothetical protein